VTATPRPPSGTTGPGRPVVWLARHGETEWSRTLRHTGRTDLTLTPEGEREARALRAPLAAVDFDRVLCSPLSRARATCDLAGLGDRAELRDDLLEWDYGDYEGMTSADIHADRPGWLLWRDGCPGGESPADVGARADRIIAELLGMEEGMPGGTTVAVFAHGHVLRVVCARWLDLPPADGRLFGLGTATLSRLGWEHDYRVIQRWNAPV
jgi:probable phosphoglycerate mutase